METTYHAGKRMQQRGINEAVIDLIMNYGRQEPISGGAIGIFLGDKEYRAFRKLIEKAKNSKVIIKDGHILTCYKKLKT